LRSSHSIGTFRNMGVINQEKSLERSDFNSNRSSMSKSAPSPHIHFGTFIKTGIICKLPPFLEICPTSQDDHRFP
jgi:hypothetical protein